MCTQNFVRTKQKNVTSKIVAGQLFKKNIYTQIRAEA